jgi:hypothetical protein
MKLTLISIKHVTSTDAPHLIVRVAQRGETPEGYADVTFEIEVKGIDFMAMTLQEIESLASSRAAAVIAK